MHLFTRQSVWQFGQVRPPIDGGIILITGASSGLGLEMAKILAPRAARLILVARRKDRLDALATDLKSANPKLEVDVEVVDLSIEDQTAALADRLLEKHQALDIVINNAGFGDVALFDQRDWRKYQQLIAVNVTALTLLTHKFLPSMIARKKGGILNVSSGYGVTWMPGLAVYCASKHFVTAFTESLRTELTGTRVVVSQLCPGPSPTEFDQVAETPLHMPSIMQVSPERVARTGIDRFSRGHALIVPGILIRFVIFLGARTPRFLLRLAYRWMGPYYRKRISGKSQLADQRAPTALP